jgi:hypothetical protein
MKKFNVAKKRGIIQLNVITVLSVQNTSMSKHTLSANVTLPLYNVYKCL